MNQEIKITFYSLPSIGSTITIARYLLYPTNTTVSTTVSSTFVTTATNPGEVTIGANTTATATNYVASVNRWYNSTGEYTIYSVGNTVVIT